MSISFTNCNWVLVMYHMVRCSQGGTLNVLLHVDGHLSSGRVPIPSSVGPSVKHAESDGLERETLQPSTSTEA